MAAYSWGESENLVGDGAELHADVFGLHMRHDPRVPWHSESVANPLRAEQHRIEEVLVGRGTIFLRLAAVK